jgi:ABC-type multidrug transport system fused ATPase/permease subunit
MGGAGGLLLLSRRASERGAGAAWEAQSSAYLAFSDILEGRLEVVASGRRHAFLADLRGRAALWSQASVRLAVWQALSGRLPLVATAGFVALVLLAAGNWRLPDRASIGDVVLLASATPAYAGLGQGLQALTRARRWVALVGDVLHRPRETGPQRGQPPPAPVTIALEGVSFRYTEDSGPDVLRRVDLSFAGPGALALVGPNGSGKSTLLRLLLGLAKPYAGRVVVGSVPLEDVDADLWRARAAFVPQRPYFPLRADVARAIRWLATDASEADMLRALDRVGLLQPLRVLSGDPLAVPVGTLSVGQRQRVALARMLCQKAALYVLDEPDANLDAPGIALVAEIVADLSRERTVIFAVHTPELLRAAGRIVALEGGCIVGEETTPALRPNGTLVADP